MNTLQEIRNQLIDRILVAKNKKLLQAIDKILDSTETDEKLLLGSEQIEMLQSSKDDIDKNNLISESDLKKSDSKWMN
ncbi:MAG TPA: hypothetical protein VKA27_07795 [Sunxiuqinia sp.]|nr:hypothetical protein [Sunxiuqinia sp.]